MEKMTSAQKALIGAAALSPFLLSTTASAQETDPTTAVDDVNSMVSDIGGITAGIVGVVIGAMTVRLAVKQVNRLMTKA